MSATPPPIAARTAEYYAHRAAEYERIYRKPERQQDLAALREVAAQYFAGEQVLEMACGTGYWTEVVSHTCAHITGLDINQEVLAIARSKHYTHGNAQFVLGDLYAAPFVADRLTTDKFSAGLAVFWWSHVERGAIADFLQAFHDCLNPGARVLLLDNRYVDGSSTAISRRDAAGNTYQERRLDDGSRYEVLKNFPSAATLKADIAPFGVHIQVVELPYYWYATYQVRGNVLR